MNEFTGGQLKEMMFRRNMLDGQIKVMDLVGTQYIKALPEGGILKQDEAVLLLTGRRTPIYVVAEEKFKNMVYRLEKEGEQVIVTSIDIDKKGQTCDTLQEHPLDQGRWPLGMIIKKVKAVYIPQSGNSHPQSDVK